MAGTLVPQETAWSFPLAAYSALGHLSVWGRHGLGRPARGRALRGQAATGAMWLLCGFLHETRAKIIFSQGSETGEAKCSVTLAACGRCSANALSGGDVPEPSVRRCAPTRSRGVRGTWGS